jgi:hypothetical protein
VYRTIVRYTGDPEPGRAVTVGLLEDHTVAVLR